MGSSFLPRVHTFILYNIRNLIATSGFDIALSIVTLSATVVYSKLESNKIDLINFKSEYNQSLIP